MKLINNFTRKSLLEGRSFQMGFAFCRRKDKLTFETVHPISPCKDYLNDVFVAETAQRGVDQYGLNYNPSEPILTGDRAYITFAICTYKNGDKYPNFDKDSKNLTDNIGNIQKFINNFEKLLKIKKLSIIKIVDEGFIIAFSPEWLKGGYAISLLSLLLRVGQWYDGEENVIEYLKEFYQNSDDVYIVKSVLLKIETLIKNGMPQEDATAYKALTSNQIHNGGILSKQL